MITGRIEALLKRDQTAFDARKWRLFAPRSKRARGD